MIELVFLACLKAEPDICGEKVMKFMPAASAMLCMAQAQPHLAGWAGDHPDQRIAHWTCREMARDLSARNDPGFAPLIEAP